MKFTFEKTTDTAPVAPARVGDVFKAKASGPKGRAGTRYWMIAAITKSQHGGSNHHLLGLSATGEIVSTSSYSGWVMNERERVGHCAQFAELQLDVTWEVAP